jgi:hypothetical protein
MRQRQVALSRDDELALLMQNAVASRGAKRLEPQATLRALEPLIGGCFRRHDGNGAAEVTLTVGPGGRAHQVHVGGPPAASPTAACIIRLVRSAAFTPQPTQVTLSHVYSPH